MALWAQWTACRGHSHCCWSRNIQGRGDGGCWQGKGLVSIWHKCPPKGPFVLLCDMSWTLLWGFCPACSVQLQLPCCAPSPQASPRTLGPAPSCSHLPPNYRPSPLPSVLRDLSISPVPRHNLPTGCPGPGCALEQLLLWLQLLPCTELQCTSLGMRPVWKTGSSARKMGLQLDFRYTGKGDNSIFFSLFSLIPF